jgi:DDB1- and CUL4-associated factor 8
MQPPFSPFLFRKAFIDFILPSRWIYVGLKFLAFLAPNSDDTSLCIWNYNDNAALKQQFATGHTANIFCARFVPGSDNRRVVSCAGDNQIRVFDLNQSHALPSQSTSSSFRTNSAALPPYRVYDAHDGRTKKIAFDSERPDSIFFSASEDGTVRMFDIRTPFAESQRGRTSRSNYGVVVDLRDSDETIEIYSVSISGNLIAVAGGDPHVRIYDLRSLRDVSNAKNARPMKYLAPPALSKAASAAGRPNLWTSSRGHITGISFRGKEVVASYIGDAIYLFDVDENLDAKATKPIMSGLGPAGLRELRDEKKGKEKASDKKKRKHKDKKSDKKANKRSKSSNDDDDDDMMVDSHGAAEEAEDRMDDNDDADIFGPPDPRQVFGEEGLFYQRKFTGHCSIRTIKECSFFGPQQEYIVSGSDCGHIFIWDKETGRIVNVMKGDSSIVNSIQGHPHDGFVLASSGIESNVKLWQPGDDHDSRSVGSPLRVYTCKSHSNCSEAAIDEVVQSNNETLADNSRASAGIPLSVIRHILRNLRAQTGDDDDEDGGDVTLNDLMRSINGGDDEPESSAADGADEDEDESEEEDDDGDDDDSESQSQRRRSMCRQS